MTDAEIKDILLNKKWFSTIYNDIDALYTAVSNYIAGRITTLAERYDETMSSLEKDAADLEAKVKSHLKRMGFTW